MKKHTSYLPFIFVAFATFPLSAWSQAAKTAPKAKPQAPAAAPAKGARSLAPRDSFEKNTYRNDDFGFELTIPKGWRGKNQPNLPHIIFVGEREKVPGKWKQGVSFRPNVTLGVEIVPPGIGTKDYAAAAANVLVNSGWQIRSEKALKWGGVDGYEVQAISPKQQVELVQRYAVVRGGAVVLAGTTRQGEQGTYKNEFAQIFGSFKVRPNQASGKGGKRGGN